MNNNKPYTPEAQPMPGELYEVPGLCLACQRSLEENGYAVCNCVLPAPKVLN